ncbi:MFS general substrate transporter [Stipitochalara longipes BDJ]|nr:MFS general substrate transporter [Stipitochalara longipes BDJ]
MDHETAWDSVPLVEKDTASDYEDEDEFATTETRSRWDYVAITIPFFGLQLAWTTQQVYGVPYLSSLGVPDGQMSIFVLSGPLAGLIGPPVVAALSDSLNISDISQKRKLFIFVGGLGTILSFLLLAVAEPFALTLHRSLLNVASSNAARTTSQVIAGLSIYALNFSIQPLQLGLRATVVDHFAPDEQPAANLCISVFSALGSVFIALVGLAYKPVFLDLSIVVVSVLALLLGFSALIDPPTKLVPQYEAAAPISLRAHLSRLLKKARHLPPITRRTCRVQLLSWVAWFLVLNYTSALISRTEAESANAVSRVALLFYTTALTTLVVVAILWRRSRSRRRIRPDGDYNCKSEIHHGSGELARTREVLMCWVWKPCLVALAGSLFVTCFLVLTLPTPSRLGATVISILLGSNGMLFALANWVPYALIADEASAHARTRVMVTADHGTMDNEDDTPGLLAVHSMAIASPQIGASVASWLVMQGLALLGLEQHVVWIFVMCIPFALGAACLLR